MGTSWLVGGLCVLLAVSLACGEQTAQTQPSKLSDGELEQVRGGFEARRDAMLKSLAGKPFVEAKKAPPLNPGRAPYVRAYTYSVTDFAMRAMWLDEREQLDAANKALLEMCRYFIANRDVRDDYDNFYWSADVTCRLVEFFGRKGSRAAGRLSPETEDAIYEMMWVWVKDHSKVARADTEVSKTWVYYASENHHLQNFSTCWQFAKFLKDDPRYRDRPYEDGKTAAEHYAAWTAYAKEYLRERAKKSLFIEVANGGYGFMSLKGIYNFFDFAEDPVLKKRAGQLLDLYWATWAEEQFQCVRGGGKARIYQTSSLRGPEELSAAAWYYLNVGTGRPPRMNEFTPVTSQYRLPLVVIDIALDPEGRGVYETKQYPLGLHIQGEHVQGEDHFRTDAGGIYRYSYCTPDFILGATMFEARPREDWGPISSQNRWHGAIFAGQPDARIFPQAKALARNRVYNALWSVQAKGTLISQKLKTQGGGGEWRVWFATSGLSNRLERDGWVFVEAKGAFAALRPVAGSYDWRADERFKAGQWLTCSDQYTPVILEAARKSGFADYAAFQDRVLANPLKFDNQVLEYKSLYGDTLTFFADQSQPPKINGTTVSYAPGKAFDSPFVQGDWDSGVVTVQKAGRKIVLDFNSEK